jgi:hypothetical protein
MALGVYPEIKDVSAVLDRWRPWLAVAAVLIVIACGLSLARLIATAPLTTPGFRVW